MIMKAILGTARLVPLGPRAQQAARPISLYILTQKYCSNNGKRTNDSSANVLESAKHDPLPDRLSGIFIFIYSIISLLALLAAIVSFSFLAGL